MRRCGRRVAWLIVLVLWAGVAVAEAQVAREQPPMPRRLRIALVPLDDRPVSLQYPQMMAGLAHAEVVAPPIEVLGRFTTPGDTAAIARWLRDQDWRDIDALVVSFDMLAYGGLVASRVHGVDEATALERLSTLRDIARANPALPIHGFTTIMRLAPTADGRNEAYRDRLARWAEIADDARPGEEATELAGLVAAIPPAALEEYTRARARNRRINMAAAQLVADGIVDFLIVSQDDARPRGVHLRDREAVTRAVSDLDLVGRVGVQPGADEVAMLLLARSVVQARGLQPAVRVTYSSDAVQTMVAPFEDRELHETVAFQLVSAGSGEAKPDDLPALDLHVFGSRHDARVPEAFASHIIGAVDDGARVVVADVDPKGDVQGGSAAFTEALLAAKVFPKLYGYASWNTAGNTLGTAIAHGLLAWSGAHLAMRCTSAAWTTMADAQVTFMLHRLVNDYAYQGVLRLAINADLRAAGRTPLWLAAHVPDVAARIREGIAPKLAAYATMFTAGAYVLPTPAPTDVAVQVGLPRNLDVRLPWARTFEAAITFDVPTAGLAGPARRLPACAPVQP